jgi:glycosyltransferase involved in cell wall biosynthesis
MRICFYPAMEGKPWNGHSLDHEPLGGSEAAVAAIARSLAARGHEVFVFSRGEPGEFDDVVYLPFERAKTILLTLPLDVLVCSRDMVPVTWATRAPLRILWCHDMPQGPLPKPFDLYVFVSNFQANLTTRLGFADSKRVRIAQNGVDLRFFRAASPRSSGFAVDHVATLAWLSNPERGLWHAARILELVRQAYPNAELHVFGRNSIYGWNAESEHVYYPEDATPQDLIALGDASPIKVHEAQPRPALAECLRSMDLVVYPTWWPETFCMAALEAQAAGVPVVATQLAALPETVKGGLLVPGCPGVDDYDRRFAQMVVHLLRDDKTYQRLSRAARAYAETMDWSQHALQWEGFFSQTKLSQSTKVYP